MKVAELMEKLKAMDKNAEVRFADTFWESEGYGPNAGKLDYLTRSVRVVVTTEVAGEKAVILRHNKPIE